MSRPPLYSRVLRGGHYKVPLYEQATSVLQGPGSHYTQVPLYEQATSRVLGPEGYYTLRGEHVSSTVGFNICWATHEQHVSFCSHAWVHNTILVDWMAPLQKQQLEAV